MSKCAFSYLALVIQDYSNRKLYDRSVSNVDAAASEKRLQKVVLLYRRSGGWAATWEEATLIDQDGRFEETQQNSLIDFSSKGIENDLGYALLHWDVSDVQDSSYEVKVQSICTHLDQAHSELNYFSTGTIEIVLDRDPPAIYGAPRIELTGPVDSVQLEEFIFPFTEVLYCKEPYVFRLQVELTNGDNSHTFSHRSETNGTGSGLGVICKHNEIRYRFSLGELDYLVGQDNEIEVTIQLDGVQDSSGNEFIGFELITTWSLVSSCRMFHISHINLT